MLTSLLFLTLAAAILYLLLELRRERRENALITQSYEAERKALTDRLLSKSGIAPIHQPLAEKHGTVQHFGHRTLRERQRDMERKQLEESLGLNDHDKATLLAAAQHTQQ
jgi:hypothetical protein